MEIDRVADFDYNDPNYILVQHFVDTGTDFNFNVMVDCAYPEEEYDKVYDYEVKMDPRKLKIKASAGMTSYDERSRFEEENYNWVKEPEHSQSWEKIKPDALFHFAIKKYKREIMRGILS